VLEQVPVSTADAMTCVLTENCPAGVGFQVLPSRALPLARLPPRPRARVATCLLESHVLSPIAR
jgi:hypothetical protein